jgi:outer membrane lipoprotein-sorting protein
MKKTFILFFAISAFVTTSFAGVEERAAEVKASVSGQQTYHAEMAKGLANAAEDELAQGEANVARGFIEAAEKHAKLSQEEK